MANPERERQENKRSSRGRIKLGFRIPYPMKHWGNQPELGERIGGITDSSEGRFRELRA